MNILSRILALVALVALMSSCGINYALVEHQNQNATQVKLSQNNYKVVERVSGTADVSYVLIFGGLKKKQLYSTAYSKMLEAAKLENSSKAVINVLTEEHMGGLPPFFTKRTLTVSAYVVEFNN